ncbi:uncharacterized protein STEHIDRAFT_128352 [Stereum hirsutum FP-91666 SS1]|uniref:uncharacterized protein n=1 Tax=Stereum hirsutum (strain FP-91666) TaxID=721885 RepID=UPI000440A7BE|nr:uncharacterized protein STEHIDRAFT_128352 [Stereum hirsutum FP-91666 SS1]EIM91480.1 hypothetical protein STEHIDRAFT_128352 [Stereum hirsutum FP-91666 SS1]
MYSLMLTYSLVYATYVSFCTFPARLTPQSTILSRKIRRVESNSTGVTAAEKTNIARE